MFEAPDYSRHPTGKSIVLNDLAKRIPYAISMRKGVTKQGA